MQIRSIIPLIIAVCLDLSCESDDSIHMQRPDNVNIQLTSILQNNMKYLEFTYDSLNRLSYSDLYYDNTTYTRTTYLYDSENRLIGKSYDGYTETYEYNSNGLPESVTKHYLSTDKVWKRIFLYEDGRITGAEIYYNDIQTDYAVYEYDTKENTAEIREYPVSNENSEFIMVHQKFRYDKAINPLNLIGFTPVDLLQTNNPIYVYYGNALWCRGPVEYDASFEYDNNDLPIKEYRTFTGYSDSDEYTYNYHLILK